jgi:hypothetical protein
LSKNTKVKSVAKADGERRRKPGGMKVTGTEVTGEKAARREVTGKRINGREVIGRKGAGKEAIGKEDPTTSPDKRSMNTQPFVSEDRIAAARERISEGFYDRDEVRRAIAEALVFVLGARRD